MKKIFLLFIITAIAHSCSKEDYDSSGNNQDGLKAYDVVLQERSSDIPAKWDKIPTARIRVKSGSNDFMPDDYLGHSYKVSMGNGFIGDQDNTGDRVINIDLILAGRYKSMVSNKGVNESFNEAFSYSNFERYYRKNKDVKRFNSGFELNIKLFKIGHTSKITKTFEKKINKIKNAVYGEVSAGIVTGSHTLSTNKASLNRIASEYLDPSFVQDLYYTPMAGLIDHYGEFVLTGYYTGGRAQALYMGSYDELTTLDNIEKDMDQTLNASYAWGSSSPESSGGKKTKADAGGGTGNSVSGNVGWGKSYSRKIINENKVKEVYFTFKAIGGDGITNNNMNPNKIDDISINLDSWITSLSTPSKQRLIQIMNKGLTGINSFIMEENLKQRFQDTHLDLCRSNEFLVPHIEIVRIPVRMSASGVQLYDIAPVLYTRHGDLIIMQDGKAATSTDAQLLANSNEATFNQKCQVIANRKALIYQKLKITKNFKKIVNPRFRYPLNFRVTGVDEAQMFKFYNEDTEMWYMYDNTSRIAFAFWYDEYIPEFYGLSEWFDSLPEKKISMVSLSNNFRVFGL